MPIYKVEVYKQYHRLKLYCQQFGLFIFDFFWDQTMCTYRQIRPGDASYMSRKVRSLKEKNCKIMGDAAYIDLKGSG